VFLAEFVLHTRLEGKTWVKNRGQILQFFYFRVNKVGEGWAKLLSGSVEWCLRLNLW